MGVPHRSTSIRVRRGVIALLMLASLASGPAGATAATRTVTATVDASGSVTITDHGSYSDVSRVANDGSRMSCNETIAVRQDGSASETITYSYHRVDEQPSNGYQSKRTVDITGSGSVQYDPQLFVTVNQDGTYDLGFGVSDPGITAQETVTFEVTGQQPQTTQTTAHVHCAYNPGLLRGKLSGGQVLSNTVDEYGHWNTDEDHNDYGSSTVAWTITDPAAHGGTSPGPPGPIPPLQVLLYGAIEIDDQGSYSSTVSGVAITSRMTCKETITVHQDGSATETITYSYHRVDDQTSNGNEIKRTIVTTGSGTVQYDPELTATIDRNGSYRVALGNDPGILVQATSTIQTTGQQTQAVQATISVHCAYNPSLLQGTLRLPCGQVLQITVSKDGYWNTDEDHDDYGPSTVIVEITDPNLPCGPHPSHGSMTATATATATPTSTPTDAATATATLSGWRCVAKRVSGYAAPTPPASSNPGWDTGSMARRTAGSKAPRKGAAATIRWQRTPQLTWTDFKAPPSSTSPWAAVTTSGTGASVGYSSAPACQDPATGLWKITIHYTIGSQDALFYPSRSWVRVTYALHPTATESVYLLNHEQRHFDISEVYSRKIHDQLLALLGGSTTRAFTCADWTGCMQQIHALYMQLDAAVQQTENQREHTQDRYDLETDYSRKHTQQEEWNGKIDGWLADPSSAP